MPLLPLVPHCRCRIELHYSDGTFQTVSFFVLPPLNTLMARYGRHAATTAFYTDSSDPFGRAPSVMPWDRDAQQHVVHDGRNFIVGLSDEAGAGANVGFASKEANAPVCAGHGRSGCRVGVGDVVS